ncbi:hypothetical protein pb186bvf_003790 [Paramecium bursaria]
MNYLTRSSNNDKEVIRNYLNYIALLKRQRKQYFCIQKM